MAKHTDLEHMVLGIVWKRRQCTGYEVVREFAQSAAAHYRSREGAIYPLLARLVARRLLRCRELPRGSGKARAYKVSPAGLRVLRAWLRGPIPQQDATVPPDLVRVRIYFLGAIGPAEQRKMLRDAAEKVRFEIASIQQRLAQSRAEGNDYAAMALSGIVRVMRARQRWISSVAGQIGSRNARVAGSSPGKRPGRSTPGKSGGRRTGA